MYDFLDTIFTAFLDHCPMNPDVVCQPLSKIDMLICSLLLFHILCVPYNFFRKCAANQIFGSLVREHRRSFKRGNQTNMELWYRGKEVLINWVIDSTHKENIKKTREAITPIADAKKLCVSKYSIERSKSSRSRAKWYYQFRNS